MASIQKGSFKKAILAAAVAAFLQLPVASEARFLAGSVTERKQNRKIESMLKSARNNLDKGKVQPAIDSYWKILELDPNETFAYLELGEVYVNLRIFDRAVEMLEPGLTMAEREMDRDTICYYYCVLTNAHIGLNQIGQANKALLKAAEASPKNPMPRKVMGDIYLANDRVADAMKAYRKAVELDSTYQPAVEKLGELVAKYGEQPPARTRDKQVIQAKAEKLPPAKPATAKAEPIKPDRQPTAAEPLIALPVKASADATNTPADTKTVTSAEPLPQRPKPEPAAIPEPPPAVAATEPAPRPIPEKPSPAVPAATETRVTPAPKPVPVAAASPAANLATGPTAAAASGSAGISASATEIENQLDKLLAGTPEEKSAATSFFVKLEEKGLTEIEELLYDPDPEVRILAVRTLPEFKAFTQRVKTMLQDAGEDPDPMVVEEINKALAGL